MLLRLLRFYECMLHPTLRNAFLTRNDQKTFYELDARNSEKPPDDYYTLVADMYNSSIVLHSRVLNVEYGEPFHVITELRQPTPEHRYTGESDANACARMNMRV